MGCAYNWKQTVTVSVFSGNYIDKMAAVPNVIGRPADPHVEPHNPDNGIVSFEDLVPGTLYKVFQKRDQLQELFRDNFRRSYRIAKFIEHNDGKAVMTVYNNRPGFQAHPERPRVLESIYRFLANPGFNVVYTIDKDMGDVPFVGAEPNVPHHAPLPAAPLPAAPLPAAPAILHQMPAGAGGGRRRKTSKSRRHRKTTKKSYRKKHTRRG